MPSAEPPLTIAEKFALLCEMFDLGVEMMRQSFVR
jgi:hypothetical protein